MGSPVDVTPLIIDLIRKYADEENIVRWLIRRHWNKAFAAFLKYIKRWLSK